jgi:hypothetical protein
MMPMVRRVLVVLAAFLAASCVAAFVITFGMLMEWQEILAGTGAGWLTLGFFSLIVSAKALLPAMVLIALTEGLRIRSSLFYAVSGGLGFVALYYGLGLADRDVVLGRDLEIMAGAGIAAGFVYWLLAGRKAGCWREQAAAGP